MPENNPFERTMLIVSGLALRLVTRFPRPKLIRFVNGPERIPSANVATALVSPMTGVAELVGATYRVPTSAMSLVKPEG